MEFCFRLTLWECIICGIRRASGRLLHIPSEVIGIYERCGKYTRTVRIEDGSLFVVDRTDTREYLCRNVWEFQKKGRIYWIVMAGRVGKQVQLYLPVRVVGDEQAQDAFWKYLNDQRRISGDKLVMHGNSPQRYPAEPYDEAENDTNAPEHDLRKERYIIQRWNLNKLSGAVGEFLWIQCHCMKKRWWKDWGMRRLPYFLTCAVVFLVLWQLLGMQTIPICLALFAMLGFWTSQELEQREQISMKDVRGQVKSWGSEIYEEVWKLSLTPDKICRKALYLENVWEWDLVGYFIETEEFYHFFDRRQTLMFYVEKALFGDWMAQKLFVQECQERGIRYQSVQPKLVMDDDLPEKILPIADISEKKKRHRRRAANTQDGWREFWAEKEKKRGGSDKKQIAFVVLGIAAVLLLAFVLPEYGGRSEFVGMSSMMDMPQGEDPYVFHPESYKDYTPLETQAEVLESLGFKIPEEAVAELRTGMEEMPVTRVWVEGYPYRRLLSLIGMPKRNYDTWEMEGYSDQAYWFDWEGFDMSREYVYILGGVNAMAKGEFTITDARQEMSDEDWEKGSGVVHVSFCVNEIPFEYEMKLQYDWLDSKIIGDINDALKKSGIEKQVYATADDGQGCILMYGDGEWAKQFRKATGIKLETE